MQAIAAVGVDMKAVTDKLLLEGLASFQKSWDSLLGGLESKRSKLGMTAAAK